MSTELTVQQAAELTGLSTTRIYQFIYQNRIEARKEPAHKERGIWYVNRESLERFRANQLDPFGDIDLFSEEY